MCDHHLNIQMKYAARSVAQSNRTNIYENFVKRNAEKLDSSCWTLFDRVNAQSDTKRKFEKHQTLLNPNVKAHLQRS